MEIMLKDCLLIVHKTGLIEKIDRRNHNVIPINITKNKQGYLCIRIDYKKVPIHKIVAMVYLGCTSLMEITHINHNKGDNGVDNLLVKGY